jgi:hypothetical protein
MADIYFRFKVSLPFRPYMYIHIKTETLQETMAYLGKKYNGPVTAMEILKKEDLVRQIFRFRLTLQLM